MFSKERGICNCEMNDGNVIRVHLFKNRFSLEFEFVKCDSLFKIFNIHPIYPYKM